MICKHKSTKLDGSKYCYESLTIQLNISDLLTQLNDPTVLFQTIQFLLERIRLSLYKSALLPSIKCNICTARNCTVILKFIKIQILN